MEDTMRRGTTTRGEQWFSHRMTVDRDEKKATSNGLGAGALHFIRNRGSMRRQLMQGHNTNRVTELFPNEYEKTQKQRDSASFTTVTTPSAVDNVRNVLGSFDMKSEKRDRVTWDS
ncbi:hypothetical protein PV327_010988 [Microctonus hyperodae]|uniref:Uncharacterized protein n=1 Tax=Microctonus hyperodae TaxID=165561 RepID=A0AA39C7V3_MICHY|nr:hypothetical protein PV327_010988 [Microctonus hyperodae]